MQPDPQERGATTAQLKHDIDTGRTGDKVAGFDPAAAPLGTDEEASGVRPPPELVELDRRNERADHSTPVGQSQAPKPENSIAPDAARNKGVGPMPVILGAAAALLVVAALLLVRFTG